MSRPTIGVVIATPGRRSLLRTLNSIEYQGLEPGDDVLVVGDGHHEPTAEIVRLLGSPFRYAATTRTRDWGHSQQNWGLQQVRGDWLLLQDDDDIFLPRAFEEARTIVSKLDSPRPVIGRVMTPYLGILWTEPGREPLDGHCLLVPNDKKKLGYFGLEYVGDQKWLSSNLDAYDTYTWADRIWTLTRPTGKLWPRRVATSDACAWTFHRDDDGVWRDEHLALLVMVRLDNDTWQTRLIFQQSEGGPATPEEIAEIVQFAAWAGQGSDVWFVVKLSGGGARYVIAALHANGYKLHEHNAPADFMDFIFEWPPHKFEPPPKEPA